MAVGFFNAEDTLTEEGIARRRKMAEILMEQGASTAPVAHWTQGLARVLGAGIGAYKNSQLDVAEKGNQSYTAGLVRQLLGDTTSPAASTDPAKIVPPSPATQTNVAADKPNPLAYRDAIASIESKGSGDYGAVGPTHPKYGRALGRYQVMEANVGPWSEAALGRRVSADEFMKDPALQDAVFDHRFGSYVQKYGNPQDAASAWFTGRPLAQGAGAKDVLGTSGAGYVGKFNAALGQGGGTSAMGYAPQAIAQALNAPLAPQAAAGAPNARMAALAAFLTDPRVDKGTKGSLGPLLAQQLTGDKVNPVDLGDRIALMNSRGQVTGYLPKSKSQTFGPIGQDQYGNNQYGFIDPQSGSVKPVQLPQATASAPEAVAPGGTATPAMPPAPAGVNPKIWRDEWTREQVRGGPKLTEGETNAGSFASRMVEAENVLSKFENEGTSTYNKIAGSVPFVGSQLLGKEAQQYDQAKRTFINSVLRKESGAAIGKEEFANADKQYFPQPGDAPEVVKQKREARRIAIEGMKTSAGKAFKEPAPKPAAPESDGWQEIDGIRIRRMN